MDRVDTSRCLAQVLVCVNERPGSQLPCCADGNAEAIYDELRQWLQKHRLLTQIWLTRTECMGWCHEEGTTIAIYPDNIWYRAVRREDCSAIIDRHLRRHL